MWGINLININLPQDVHMVLLEQVDRWDDDWVVRHQNVSEQNLTKSEVWQPGRRRFWRWLVKLV